MKERLNFDRKRRLRRRTDQVNDSLCPRLPDSSLNWECSVKIPKFLVLGNQEPRVFSTCTISTTVRS